MGGVSDQDCDGFVIGQETGRQMKLSGLLHESGAALLEDIRGAVLQYAKEWGLDVDSPESGLSECEAEDFECYVQDNQVILIFDTDTLEAGYVGALRIPCREIAC